MTNGDLNLHDLNEVLRAFGGMILSDRDGKPLARLSLLSVEEAPKEPPKNKALEDMRQGMNVLKALSEIRQETSAPACTEVATPAPKAKLEETPQQKRRRELGRLGLLRGTEEDLLVAIERLNEPKMDDSQGGLFHIFVHWGGSAYAGGPETSEYLGSMEVYEFRNTEALLVGLSSRAAALAKPKKEVWFTVLLRNFVGVTVWEGKVVPHSIVCVHDGDIFHGGRALGAVAGEIPLSVQWKEMMHRHYVDHARFRNKVDGAVQPGHMTLVVEDIDRPAEPLSGIPSYNMENLSEVVGLLAKDLALPGVRRKLRVKTRRDGQQLFECVIELTPRPEEAAAETSGDPA